MNFIVAYYFYLLLAECLRIKPFRMCHLLLESHTLHLAEGFRKIFFKTVESQNSLEKLVSLKKDESNESGW